MVETSSLRKALAQLRKTLVMYDRPEMSDDFLEKLRTASIHEFEYCYGISIKMIRRALEEKLVAPEEVDLLSFKNLIRTAAEKGLIQDPLAWFEFREKRNITSHSYDEKYADEVFGILRKFVTHCDQLLEELDTL